MPGLLNLHADLSIADVVHITKDLHPVFAPHVAWLSTKFPGDHTSISDMLSNILQLNQLASIANKENSERVSEQTEQTILQAQIVEYVKIARRRARRVFDKIKGTKLPMARKLAASIGLNSRLSVTRNSEVNQLLTKTVSAHARFRDLLKSWGSSDEFLDQAQILADALPVQTAEFRKEQAEAEIATANQNAVFSTVLSDTNDLIEAINEYGPTENPELFQKVSSILNKYQHLLSRTDDAVDIGDEDGDDEEGEDKGG